MINLQAVRDGLDEQLVNNAVRFMAPPVDDDPAVVLLPERSGPEPTAGRTVRVDQRQRVAAATVQGDRVSAAVLIPPLAIVPVALSAGLYSSATVSY